MPLSILDRHILRQVIVPALLAVTVIGFLAIGVRLSSYAREIPLELVTPRDLAELCVVFMPSLISMIIPVTLLLGVLMGVGRLAQRNELTALRSSGLSLRRIVAPILGLAFVLSAASFFIQDTLQPMAISRALDLIYRELPRRATLINLRPGVMHRYEGWQVYFRDRDVEQSILYDIDIVQPSEDGPMVYHADSAQFVVEDDDHLLRLTNFYGMPSDKSMFRGDEYVLPLPLPSDMNPRGVRQSFSLGELLASEKELTAQYEASRKLGNPESLRDDLRRERKEIAERVSLPFAAIFMTLIAAPLAARSPRSGRSFSFAAGFAIILVYYVIHMLLDPPTVRSLSTHIVNAWVANAVCAVIGGVLIWRVDRV